MDGPKTIGLINRIPNENDRNWYPRKSSLKFFPGIYVEKWYIAMIGIFPVTYVEMIPNENFIAFPWNRIWFLGISAMKMI